MIFEFGDGGIAPRVALALFFCETEFTADVFVEIVRGRFSSLDGETVNEVGFGVVVGGLQLFKFLSGFLTDCNDLQSDHIHLTGLDGGIVIGESEMIVVWLAWKVEALNLFFTFSIIVDD